MVMLWLTNFYSIGNYCPNLLLGSMEGLVMINEVSDNFKIIYLDSLNENLST